MKEGYTREDALEEEFVVLDQQAEKKKKDQVSLGSNYYFG